jgi:putative phosphoribosyl transferase
MPSQAYRFIDRREAGRRLAQALDRYAGRADLAVLALPRGGVPVGYEIAAALQAPLDIFEVRKLGVPGHEELAMGAIGSGGAYYLNDEIIESLGIPRAELMATIDREYQELERREKLYRDDRPRLPVTGKSVILVDDGLATGSTMRVAIEALRRQAPTAIVVAVPVAPAQTCHELRGLADDVICLEAPNPFYAVGFWYVDFQQVSDDEVRSLLKARMTTP